MEPVAKPVSHQLQDPQDRSPLSLLSRPLLGSHGCFFSLWSGCAPHVGVFGNECGRGQFLRVGAGALSARDVGPSAIDAPVGSTISLIQAEGK